MTHLAESRIDTSLLKSEALRLGFSACGVAPSAPVDEETANRFLSWIGEGRHGSMNFMERHTDKRLNPSLLMEGAKSIVSVALNYQPKQLLNPETQYEFAAYAYGQDYHEVMKTRLNLLLQAISSKLPKGMTITARLFCDTAPVLERYWAWRCGLGWIGKNTQLIIPQAGSAFFLGELLLDVSFSLYDSPIDRQCGNCTRCIEACPTNALKEAYVLDSKSCLSYLTIENREEIPLEKAEKMGNCIYGCDRCRLICPWSSYATPTNVEEFYPSKTFMALTREQLEKLSPDEYHTIFKHSSIKRAKYEGLMRNIRSAKKR